jgi:ABC-2 type transport system ATP-binding protein
LSSLVSTKNIVENTWELRFNSKDDMRSKIFDFAQENNLKIIGLTSQNKNLETLFREITS